MAKAQREWAEALASAYAVTQDEVVAFVDSVMSSAAAASGAGGSEAVAGVAAHLEAMVPLALFLSRSQGKVGTIPPGNVLSCSALRVQVACGARLPGAAPPAAAGCPDSPSSPHVQFPHVVVPKIVQALQAVVRGMEAVAADAGASGSSATDTGMPPSSSGLLPASKWASLLAHAFAELGAVLSILPLDGDWKARVSGASRDLLQQLLVASRGQGPHHAMLEGFVRAAVAAGRHRLPLSGGDAAQVGSPQVNGASWRQQCRVFVACYNWSA